MNESAPTVLPALPCPDETFDVIGGAADAGVVLICDHAANAFPPGYGTLGLPERELLRHIAYDIGAASVTRQLAAALGAPAILSRYSRLLIDLNRGADDPTLIMRISDGAVVPGNRHLDDAERQHRLERFYLPYHGALARIVERSLASGVPPVLLSIHTFTESWKGVPRPWHAGVLWDRDKRFARPLLEHLYGDGALIVGDNEPYRGGLIGDCMDQHGTSRGLAHAIIEIRQDLVRDLHGQTVWADRISAIMRDILADGGLRATLHSIQHFAPGRPEETGHLIDDR